MCGTERLVAVQKRIESERPFGTFACGWQRAGAIVRIEQVRAIGFRGSRWIRLNGGRLLLRLTGCSRRQIERSLAPATGKRQRSGAQQDESPSSMVRAVVRSHVKIPNAGRTIQRLVCSGETLKSAQFPAEIATQPNFRSFSSRLSQALACAATFFGAVPPKLVRLFTDASTESTEIASLVMSGSIACIAFSGNSCKATPSADAFATIRPVTWWASRNGIFSVRTSQSARSVAVA